MEYTEFINQVEENVEVTNDRLSPHDWFCKKYSIDIFEERLSEREHTGHDVIKFMDRYLKYYKTGEL